MPRVFAGVSGDPRHLLYLEIMPAPRADYNLTKRGLMRWDEAAQDFVAWDGSVSTGAGGNSGLSSGSATVTTAGTPVAVAVPAGAQIMVLMARANVTGRIAIGAEASVDATVGSGAGIFLYADDSVPFPVSGLSNVYIDATVSGEGVVYTCF